MMRAILPPLFGVMLLTTVCPIAAAQDSLRVTLLGQVFAEETGKPLAGAHVFIAETRYGSATNAYGIYRIDGVPLGLGDLVVSMPGYAPQTVTVHITEQAEYRYNVKLTKTDDPKQAWATWAQGLAALADAEQLDVRQADAFVRNVFQEEDEGRYEQAAAVYLALLERLDTAPSKQERKIIARQVAQVEFLLPDNVRADSPMSFIAVHEKLSQRGADSYDRAIWTKRPGSWTAAGARRTSPLTSEKIEAFAPMPSASVSAATTVKAGARRSTRAEYLRS